MDAATVLYILVAFALCESLVISFLTGRVKRLEAWADDVGSRCSIAAHGQHETSDPA